MNLHVRLKKELYSAIEEKYRCPHSDRELRRRIIADGRPSYVTQCVKCGHTSQPIKAKVAVEISQGVEIPLITIFWQGNGTLQRVANILLPILSINPTLKQNIKPISRVKIGNYCESKFFLVRRENVKYAAIIRLRKYIIQPTNALVKSIFPISWQYATCATDYCIIKNHSNTWRWVPVVSLRKVNFQALFTFPMVFYRRLCNSVYFTIQNIRILRIS